jgi:hypothetical protein
MALVLNLLSILLSIEAGFIRHSKKRAVADRVIRQRFTDLLPDFRSP